MKKYLFILLTAYLMVACDQNAEQDTEGQEADTTAVDTTQQEAKASLNQVWATDTTLDTPESVIFDQEQNVFYVANIGSDAFDSADAYGFISKVSPSGNIEELNWVTEGLDAPKGMGLSNDTLYVADLNEIVAINTGSGEVVQTWPVEGATFLNDIAVTENEVYISDSEESKIYKLENGEVTEWMSEGLQGPNGLYAQNGNLYAATFQGKKFYRINLETKEKEQIAEGFPNADGVEYTGREGHWLISNWQGEVYLVGLNENGAEKTKILDTKAEKVNAADIEYIPRMNLLLVPTFFDDRVVAYKLQMNE